ncbi:MAG: non-ribosomal peptide synthetase, partial [Nonomuraea sp.]|nr:non-ribosomal peptide synthetase [Nonomuraea sp.]
GRAPQVRLALFQVADDTYDYLHHFNLAAQDGWSYQIMVTALLDAYQSCLSGREPVALPPSATFGDFCVEQDRRDETEAARFWQRELAGVPFPPPSITLPPSRRTAGAQPQLLQETARVTQESTRALAELARGHGLSVNTLLHGAWALMLSAITGSREVVCGAIFSGRGTTSVDIDQAVGLLFNILPVATTVDPAERLLPWLAVLQEKNSAITDHEYVSQATLHELAGAPVDSPLVESYVVSENLPGVVSNLGRFFSVLGAMPTQFLAQTEHPLRVELAVSDEFVLITLNHRAGWFPEGAVGRWVAAYVALLDAMIADPRRPLGELLPDLTD